MRKDLKLYAVCLAVALVSTPALAGGDVNFAVGGRSLDSNDFDPVDEQPFLGVTMSFEMEDWPIDLAGGLYGSRKEDSVGSVDISASVTEATFGVLKTWTVHGNMRPFVGGGAGLVRVSAEVSGGPFSINESDTSPALYGEGGVYWRLGSNFNLGVHGRLVTGTGIDIEGEDFDSNYFQVGVLAGFAWPTH